MDDLVRSISWHADKQVRRRGNFPSVLWLTQDANGMRKTYDTPCVRAPNAASDAELLDGLTNDFAVDLSEAPTRVTKFAVAYAGTRVTTTRPLDPAASMPRKTVRRKGVVIEVHDSNEHQRFFCELLGSAVGKSMLGPVEPLTEPFAGPYSSALERADKWRNKAAEAKAEVKEARADARAKVEIEAKAAAKVEAHVAARESGQWPPRFLLAKHDNDAKAKATEAVATK